MVETLNVSIWLRLKAWELRQVGLEKHSFDGGGTARKKQRQTDKQVLN